MFENLGWWEIVCLVLLALFLFGPERLPKLAGDAARFLRRLRGMARNATEELREHTGLEINDVADLHPKRLIRRHLLSEQEEEAIRGPLRNVFGHIENELGELRSGSPLMNGRSGSTTVVGADSGPVVPVQTKWLSSPPTVDQASARIVAGSAAPIDPDTT